jgi:hypothetical protein
LLLAPTLTHSRSRRSYPDIDYTKPFDPSILAIPPRARAMSAWFSCAPDGGSDPLSVHGSRPVVRGVKWTATMFVYADPKLCAAVTDKAGASPVGDHQIGWLTFAQVRVSHPA